MPASTNNNAKALFIVSACLNLIPWGLGMLGVTNLWLGSAVLFVAFCSLSYAFWIFERKGRRKRLSWRVATIAIAALVSFSLWFAWVGQYRRTQQSAQAPANQTQPTPSSLPKFSERLTQVRVSLGDHGMSYNVRSDKLNQKYPITTFVNPERPLGHVYVENGVLYFDADIFYAFDEPPISVIHNEISNRPPSWDRNFDDLGFEIVDEALRPRLQFYYATPSRIIIKGVFLSGRHLLFVDRTVESFLVDAMPHVPDSEKPPKDFQIKRLFKYPSLRYAGQRAE